MNAATAPLVSFEFFPPKTEQSETEDAEDVRRRKKIRPVEGAGAIEVVTMVAEQQRTLASPAKISGRGLFTGASVTATIPALFFSMVNIGNPLNFRQPWPNRDRLVPLIIAP